MNRTSVEQNADGAMRLYQIHISRGMTPEQAAAWAANAVAESQGNYRQPQRGGGPATGFFSGVPIIHGLIAAVPSNRFLAIRFSSLQRKNNSRFGIGNWPIAMPGRQDA
jgi:hypothetical protein